MKYLSVTLGVIVLIIFISGIRSEPRQSSSSDKGTSAAKKHQKFSKPTTAAIKENTIGEQLLNLIKSLCNGKRCSIDQLPQFEDTQLPESILELCRTKTVDCPPSTLYFRTISGTCNNWQSPFLGSALTAQKRFVGDSYDDSLTDPRSKSVTGKPLPSPRRISDKIIKPYWSRNFDLTTLFVFFGQTLDHDITLTPIITDDGEEIFCCGEENPHSACLPIEVAENDSFYGQFGQTCLEFVRSSSIASEDCLLGVREQPNQITSFVDASFLYGSDNETHHRVRLWKNGLLREEHDELLPSDVNECEQETSDVSNMTTCMFLGGDERVNEFPLLTIFHTTFLREHNKIAQFVLSERPGWNDEQIFQESRKIVIGKWQNIVYNDFLPILLGRTILNRYGLNLSWKINHGVYSDKIDPSIRIGFSTAAYRFGHTLLPSEILLYFGKNDYHTFATHHKFFSPFDLRNKTLMNGLVGGMMKQAPESFDILMTSSVTNKLFKPEEEEFGLDLASLNIQRGRDHGLPSYNTYRKFCNLPIRKSFRDLPTSCLAKTMKDVYDHVDDIDLFVGGLSEDPVPGGVVGETFACLIGLQFRYLMRGDRFFFTNGNHFNDKQIQELRKANIGKLMCENMKLDEIHWNPFLNPMGQPASDCHSLPNIDINILLPSN